jgi:hypothetical protein
VVLSTVPRAFGRCPRGTRGVTHIWSPYWRRRWPLFEALARLPSRLDHSTARPSHRRRLPVYFASAPAGRLDGASLSLYNATCCMWEVNMCQEPAIAPDAHSAEITAERSGFATSCATWLWRHGPPAWRSMRAPGDHRPHLRRAHSRTSDSDHPPGASTRTTVYRTLSCCLDLGFIYEMRHDDAVPSTSWLTARTGTCCARLVASCRISIPPSLPYAQHCAPIRALTST